MVTYYELSRPRLSWVDVYETITAACRDVRSMKAEHAAAQFRMRMLQLLPTASRSLGESWTPTLDDSLDGQLRTAAYLDDMARLGAFLGALDGRAAVPARPRGEGPAGEVYGYAYSAAYMLAANHSLVHQHTPAREVNRG